MSNLTTTFVDGSGGGTPIDAAWLNAVNAALNPWRSRAALPLTSLTGWTAGTGTWTADANGIHQTDASTSTKRLRYTASRIQLASAVVEVEVRLDSGAGNAGLTLRTGPGDVTQGQRVDLRGDGTNVTAVGFESDAFTAQGTYALDSSIAYGTWIKLRAQIHGSALAVSINDTLLTTAKVDWGNNGPYLGLVCYSAAASWRNLKVWTLVGPTEAL
ncbi:family 16 glycoside hydrolase [Intrasporangium flavum]|uniref:family 16 glycoside hydrolase n=1 Tax=Intrasporangium flavum TaxID=1428657 RepID=UPI00096DD777|nr:family 16 glycoside hydrolase [Intrasporangium flavum]